MAPALAGAGIEHGSHARQADALPSELHPARTYLSSTNAARHEDPDVLQHGRRRRLLRGGGGALRAYHCAAAVLTSGRDEQVRRLDGARHGRLHS